MLLAALAAIFCVLSFGATSAAAHDRSVVELWTVFDVAHWVNFTVGYPEYSEHFVTHLVDGPTLLNAEIEDLEDTMPITNRLHIAKFKAHLAIVKDRCLCKKETEALDFWSHARLHQTRTWVLGTAAIFAPRAALIGAFLFDGDLYEAMTSVSIEGSYDSDPANGIADGVADSNNNKGRRPQRTGRTGTQTSWLFTAAYWIVGMAFPSAFMLLNFIPYVTSNFIVVLVLSINLVVEQHREVFLIMSFLYGDMKSRSVKEIATALLPIPTAFPLVGLLLSFVAPYPLLQLAVVAMMLFSIFIGVGFVMMLFSHEEGAADEAQAAAQAAEKREAAERAQREAEAAKKSAAAASSAGSHDKID